MAGPIAKCVIFGGIVWATACAGAAALPQSTSATQPATASSQASEPNLDTLIAQLSNNSWKQRQAAQDLLVQLGAESVDRLSAVVRDSTDQEAVARAQAALRMIAENRLLGASMITLNVENAPAEKVFQELARQAHTELVPEPPDLWTQKQWPAATIHAERVEFWTVFRDACRQVGVTPDQGDNFKMRLADAEDKKWILSPAVTTGPFLVWAECSERNLKHDFADPASAVDRTLTLTLHTDAEPKLRLIRDSAAVTIEEVVDDHGNSLLPSQQGAEPSISPSGDDGHFWDIALQLEHPAANIGTRIARLRGTLHFLAPVRTETLEVDEIMKVRSVTRDLAGRRFLFRSAHRNGNGYEVKITAYRDGLPEADWQQIVNPHDFVRLADEKDRPIPFTGVSESDGGDRQITYTLQFESQTADKPNNAGRPSDVPGAPVKLVWDLPVETRALQAPFEFNNRLGLP